MRTVRLRSPFTFSAGIVWGMVGDRGGFIPEREDFQAPSAVNIKILSEMSGIPHHRSHSPILPSHLPYLRQPFPGSLRQKQSEEMPVRFSSGVWGFDIFQVRPCPQVSRRHVTQHYSQGKTGIVDREHHSAHMCPRVPSLSVSVAPGRLSGLGSQILPAWFTERSERQGVRSVD